VIARKWELALALIALSGSTARAVGPEPVPASDAIRDPYRVWWSFPVDDVNAIEVDQYDLEESSFPSRWQFAIAMTKCAKQRRAPVMTPTGASLQGRTVLRELRIEVVGVDGAVRSTSRCVMPLGAWRDRIGERLVERLDDELDAHVSFLSPRKVPGGKPPGRPENQSNSQVRDPNKVESNSANGPQSHQAQPPRADSPSEKAPPPKP
jgi:hypothetical protein